MIRFSFGRTIRDNYPCNCSSPSLEDFAQFLEDARSPNKGLTYIAGPMGGDGRRSKDNAEPRNFLPYDVDGGMDGSHEIPLSDSGLKRFKDAYQGTSRILYGSSSDRPGARRGRQIILLDAYVSRADSIRMGEYLASLTPWVKLGREIFRHEQPIFCPVGSSKITLELGEPLCVAEVMAAIPKPRPAKPRKDLTLRVGNGVAMLDLLRMAGLYLRAAGGGKHFINCPWGHLHSDGRLEAAYFDPSADNHDAGGFRCLHSHCEGRSISDLLRLFKEAA